MPNRLKHPPPVTSHYPPGPHPAPALSVPYYAPLLTSDPSPRNAEPDPFAPSSFRFPLRTRPSPQPSHVPRRLAVTSPTSADGEPITDVWVVNDQDRRDADHDAPYETGDTYIDDVYIGPDLPPLTDDEEGPLADTEGMPAEDDAIATDAGGQQPVEADAEEQLAASEGQFDVSDAEELVEADAEEQLAAPEGHFDKSDAEEPAEADATEHLK